MENERFKIIRYPISWKTFQAMRLFDTRINSRKLVSDQEEVI